MVNPYLGIVFAFLIRASRLFGSVPAATCLFADVLYHPLTCWDFHVHLLPLPQLLIDNIPSTQFDDLLHLLFVGSVWLVPAVHQLDLLWRHLSPLGSQRLHAYGHPPLVISRHDRHPPYSSSLPGCRLRRENVARFKGLRLWPVRLSLPSPDLLPMLPVRHNRFLDTVASLTYTRVSLSVSWKSFSFHFNFSSFGSEQSLFPKKIHETGLAFSLYLAVASSSASSAYSFRRNQVTWHSAEPVRFCLAPSDCSRSKPFPLQPNLWALPSQIQNRKSETQELGQSTIKCKVIRKIQKRHILANFMTKCTMYINGKICTA